LDRRDLLKNTAAAVAGSAAWILTPTAAAANEQLLEFGQTAIAPKGINTKRMEFMTANAVVVPAPPRGVPGQPRD
jgi:hypothetical protein